MRHANIDSDSSGEEDEEEEEEGGEEDDRNADTDILDKHEGNFESYFCRVTETS